jgi:hypothetical protein
MEIGQAFTFVKADEEWIKKLGFGALFVLFGFLILPLFPLVGYQVRIIRNVIDGKQRPLPKWEDFGKLFMDGLILVVAGFIYALPISLISICGIVAGNASTDTLFIVVTIVGSCLGFVYGIALMFVIPALYIQYARYGQFGSLFRFAEVIAIARGNLVNFLIIAVVSVVANLVVGIASGIAVITICGPIVVSLAGAAWVMYATGHLYGQVARGTSGKALSFDYKPA